MNFIPKFILLLVAASLAYGSTPASASLFSCFKKAAENGLDLEEQTVPGLRSGKHLAIALRDETVQIPVGDPRGPFPPSIDLGAKARTSQQARLLLQAQSSVNTQGQFKNPAFEFSQNRVELIQELQSNAASISNEAKTHMNLSARYKKEGNRTGAQAEALTAQELAERASVHVHTAKMLQTTAEFVGSFSTHQKNALDAPYARVLRDQATRQRQSAQLLREAQRTALAENAESQARRADQLADEVEQQIRARLAAREHARLRAEEERNQALRFAENIRDQMIKSGTSYRSELHPPENSSSPDFNSSPEAVAERARADSVGALLQNAGRSTTVIGQQGVQFEKNADLATKNGETSKATEYYFRAFRQYQIAAENSRHLGQSPEYLINSQEFEAKAQETWIKMNSVPPKVEALTVSPEIKLAPGISEAILTNGNAASDRFWEILTSHPQATYAELQSHLYLIKNYANSAAKEAGKIYQEAQNEIDQYNTHIRENPNYIPTTGDVIKIGRLRNQRESASKSEGHFNTVERKADYYLEHLVQVRDDTATIERADDLDYRTKAGKLLIENAENRRDDPDQAIANAFDHRLTGLAKTSLRLNYNTAIRGAIEVRIEQLSRNLGRSGTQQSELITKIDNHKVQLKALEDEARQYKSLLRDQDQALPTSAWPEFRMVP